MRMHVEYEEGDLEAMEVVFPGGVMPLHTDVVRQEMELALLRIQATARLRHEAAVSGAMRWPWAQEAPMYSTSAIWIGEPT